jgi:hypothetical protein
MGGNGTGDKDDAVRPEDAASTTEETGLVLDDELRSAATPFLYLLSSLSIAVAAYILYSVLHG